MALVFLTRIPLPQIPWEEERIPASVPFFPLAGAVIGALLWCIYTWGQLLLPPTVLAAVLVVSDIAITGGMHMDAVADTMDGLFCYGDREKRLTVMRDSRIGAYGVMGMFLLLLLKYTLFLPLIDCAAPQAVLISPVLGRWVMTYSMYFLPYVRKEGLGKDFVSSKSPLGFLYSTAITLIFAIIFSGTEGLVAAAVAMLGGILLTLHFLRQFGGMTGDTYGATNMAAEVLSLLAFVIQAYLRRG